MPLEPTPDPYDVTLVPRAAAQTFAGGRYMVVRVLGEGGQKVVYLVHDNVLDRDCALSMVRSALVDPEDLERLKREAQAMARLGSQPHVVTVFDFGDEDGTPYLVCEYVPGGDLRRELNAAAGPLALWRAISIASDVAQALEAAHARGVVHRDLKPGNIWLGDHGSAKLGDFGLAFSLDRSRLTMPGTVMGTAAYLAPEQALGEAVTERSDLYALGCLLYEMVCGKPPFADANPTVVISQHINAAPAPPSSHERNVPPALNDLILRLLAKSPARRPESATAVLDELRRIGHGAPESPNWRAASLKLATRRPRIPFVGRLRPATAYDLTVRNDGDGLRVRQRTFTTTSPVVVDDDYVWDAGAGLPVVLQDTRTPREQASSTTTYLYGLGLISETSGAGVTSYYLADGLGSTTQLTDSAGAVTDSYSYDVFGAPRTTTGTTVNNFQYAGQQRDGNANRGLYFLRARSYDPALGRFLQKDPLPLNNRYSYARNDPMNLMDPSGNFPCPGCGKIRSAAGSVRGCFTDVRCSQRLATAIDSDVVAVNDIRAGFVNVVTGMGCGDGLAAGGVVGAAIGCLLAKGIAEGATQSIANLSNAASGLSTAISCSGALFGDSKEGGGFNWHNGRDCIASAAVTLVGFLPEANFDAIAGNYQYFCRDRQHQNWCGP
ncbi:MAG: protein kinase [Chloroflexota bacterium]|nr:protein kinase [Chloroflexota bacterium]